VRLIRAVSGLDGWVGFGGAVAGPDDQGEDGPASATAAPTRKAVCIPAAKVAWLR
jgi:hypothetical protein